MKMKKSARVAGLAVLATVGMLGPPGVVSNQAVAQMNGLRLTSNRSATTIFDVTSNVCMSNVCNAKERCKISRVDPQSRQDEARCAASS